MPTATHPFTFTTRHVLPDGRCVLYFLTGAAQWQVRAEHGDFADVPAVDVPADVRKAMRTAFQVYHGNEDGGKHKGATG